MVAELPKKTREEIEDDDEKKKEAKLVDPNTFNRLYNGQTASSMLKVKSPIGRDALSQESPRKDSHR